MQSTCDAQSGIHRDESITCMHEYMNTVFSEGKLFDLNFNGSDYADTETLNYIINNRS